MFDQTEGEVPGGDIGREDIADIGGYEEYFEAMSFPASKEEVVTHLRDIGADDSLIAHVESLTGDRFERPADIFRGIMPH